MADVWGNSDFARPEPFAPLRAATAVHDEGWRRWEDAPRVRDGAPVDFPGIDRTTHVDLYRQGIRHAEAIGPRVGLLVSLHGRGLYEGRGGLDPGPPTPRSEREPAVRDFLAEQDAVVERFRARIGRDGEAAWEWAAYRLLQTWDALSLYLTWRALPAGREGVLPRVPRSAADDAGTDLRLRPLGPDRCACDPWPFAADRVELPVRAREVPVRDYADDADLAAALAEAPWTTIVSVVTPG
jgi:hypothetical protein